jgi:hypothetical protein
VLYDSGNNYEYDKSSFMDNGYIMISDNKWIVGGGKHRTDIMLEVASMGFIYNDKVLSI